jgi:hypothetical protein
MARVVGLTSIDFNDVRRLLLWLGFEARPSGGHRIYRRPGIPTLINLQKDGNKARHTKRYKCDVQSWSTGLAARVDFSSGLLGAAPRTAMPFPLLSPIDNSTCFRLRSFLP